MLQKVTFVGRMRNLQIVPLGYIFCRSIQKQVKMLDFGYYKQKLIWYYHKMFFICIENIILH